MMLSIQSAIGRLRYQCDTKRRSRQHPYPMQFQASGLPCRSLPASFDRTDSAMLERMLEGDDE